ncbi:hypothetical protein CCACVL1_22515 [Corchorus capsularis]|uniref:Uncharacterized protein n=1 Tax=Corchorus capsularis TaxID=210143 RepID=A0A1R3GY58_COCAP|nr:hypothetical protein CCACVL1_22515 [Corchorus capsularis]
MAHIDGRQLNNISPLQRDDT